MRLARSLVVALTMSTGAACGPLVTSPDPMEPMPAPASVWLTSDPTTPAIVVPVTMTSPNDRAIHFHHTFVPGEILRGVFPTSQGDYRLAALGGLCALDLSLGPSETADVVLTIGDDTCGLEVVARSQMDDIPREEPAVLITNRGVGDEEPSIEPTPPPT